METGISVAIIISALAAAGFGVVVACAALIAGFVALFVFWWREISKPLHLERLVHNPILEPKAEHWWESEAVFNPAAIVDGGRVHLFYRALGRDGISRIGYASSPDGIHFDERLPYPVYEPEVTPDPRRAPGPLSYSTVSYASGGGWGGAEDPRATKIDGQVHLSFTLFENWGSGRIGLISLPLKKLGTKEWLWKKLSFLSPPGQLHKNWVLFPERIGGKYAILHSISPKIAVEYVDHLDEFDEEERYIHGSGRGNAGRKDYWDVFVRGAGAPPIKTSEGWLLFYHGMDPKQWSVGHRVGAMLLDLENPERVLYRSSRPVLEAREWYENDWKPGVTYASGAVVVGDDLLVYYGGGDKRVAAARANLREFIRRLKSDDHAVLEPVAVTL
jgi:predicted GH43/DUF377 family glycosyl hydrolase